MKTVSFFEKAKKNYRTLIAFFLQRLAPDRYIVVKAPVKMAKGEVMHFNWGDDMNYYFTNILSSQKVYPISDSQLLKIFPIKSYLVIGSTISFYPLDGVTVWGAGIINQNDIKNVRGKPDKICAVRGPLTRKALIDLGYECPAIYGDPVLLLPKFYTPQIVKNKDTIGIVPHYVDKESSVINRIRGNSDIKIIDIQNYHRWQDFVDEICSCKAILSSSLHGLICSEAYGIPSVWIAFSEYIDGWDFKFKDYYSSIGKRIVKPIMIRDENDFYGENIKAMLSSWEKGNIDLDLLLSACPFYNK